MDSQALYYNITRFNEVISRTKETYANKFYYMQDKEAEEKASFVKYIIDNKPEFKDAFDKVKGVFDLAFGSGNFSSKIIVRSNIQPETIYLNDKFSTEVNVGLKPLYEQLYSGINCNIIDYDFFDSEKFKNFKVDLLLFNPTSGGRPAEKDYNKGKKADLITTINHMITDDSVVIFNGKEEERDLLFTRFKTIYQFKPSEGNNLLHLLFNGSTKEIKSFYGLKNKIFELVKDKNNVYEDVNLDELEDNISYQIQKIKPPRDENAIVSISEDPDVTKEKINEVLEFIESLPSDNRSSILEIFGTHHLTNEDINVLLGRKKALEIFKEEMEKLSWDEPSWQTFFDENSWIFGYGLNYQYLSILKKEAHISGVDIDGKNEVISDFLMGANKFTVLVELKRPDTPLFERDINRAESWKLSKDLTYSMSQILTQKAEWQIKAEGTNWTSDDKLIKQKTIDPKTILVIGNSIQYAGETKSDFIKAKTFELYRRNSRNIEILTYDELYERAYFIVNQKTLES